MVKYNSKDGVWRTIGGRRVFIKNGQDLASAMKESGKFGKKSDEEQSSWRDKMKDPSQRGEIINKMGDESSKQKVKEYWTKQELKDKFGTDNVDLINAGRESDKRVKLIDDKDAELDRLAEASNKIDHENRKKALTDKYLPKETEIKTQGKSNRKEVSENIQAHILDHYDNPVDFIEQMDAMDYLPTRWQAGQKLAEGGSYLIYNGDMADFLNSLKINPKGKTFSDTDAFNMYTSLIGRESSNLYDRLQKMFNDYRSQHGGSDLTLDDFRKWFE